MCFEKAEEEKLSGNDHFASGRITEAIEKYQAALTIIDELALKSQDQAEETLSSIRCAVNSNLSMAFLQQKAYEKSWKAASIALSINPEAVKVWIRYVEARRLGGYPFEALVMQLRHVRPLLRKSVERGSITVYESSKILVGIEVPLFRDLGLSDVAECLELVDCLNGVALVTRKKLKPNQVLFVEKQLRHPFDGNESFQECSTTVDMVQRYASRLRPHQASQSQEWKRFQKEMLGAWPRTILDVPEDHRLLITESLREVFPDISKDEFSELLYMSLVCRFNGFEHGFFRTCALANHSCTANIAMKLRQRNQEVVMTTVQDIDAGEFLSVKYLNDAHFLMGVGKRREFLNSWMFWCNCKRCAADIQVGAEVEEVSCSTCQTYNLYPFTPNPVTVDNELQAICQKPCFSCGAPMSEWSKQFGSRVNELLGQFSELGSIGSIRDLAISMRKILVQIEPLKLNPCHWIFRVLLYFFCLPLIQLISSKYQNISPDQIQEGIGLLFQPFGLREIYFPLLEKYVKDKGGSQIFTSDSIAWMKEGSDLLNSFLLLWQHIACFYPPYELWAIHKVTCYLVMIHLLYYDPNKFEANPPFDFSSTYALSLLQRHAKFLSSDDIAGLMHFLNVHKPFAVAPKALPGAKIKKVLGK